MAPISFSDSPITSKEVMVNEDGITSTDTRQNHAVDTDETNVKDEDVDHPGSSDNEQPKKEFKEGGYGW